MLAATTLTAQESPKRYGIKSGEFNTVTEVMGQKVNSHIWFDNYGALSRSDESSMGISITTLLKDGKTYMVDTANKQVQEMPAQESINYLDLNEDVIAKYKVSEAGLPHENSDQLWWDGDNSHDNGNHRMRGESHCV